MHQLNVFIYGPSSFISTLIELKPFLKFNLHANFSYLDKQTTNCDALICHEDFLNNEKQINNILIADKFVKILASSTNNKTNNFDGILKLPASLSEINFIIENLTAKKKFNLNSSIEIKNYILDKNEKKLSNKNSFIFLTEKEIQLLELFLNTQKPISKNKIQSLVWNYSSDTDTHTVETHIYRLRKKINDKFFDQNFILNNKEGYYL